MKSFLTREILSKRDKTLFTMRFTEELGILLGAGVKLTEALAVMETDLRGRRKEEIVALREAIENGVPLSRAMKDRAFYPDMLIGVVESGEETGDLPNALAKLSAFFREEYAAQEKLNNALIYPTVLACIVPVVIHFLLMFVLPEFMKLFADADELLPLATRILIDVAIFMNEIGQYIVMAMLALYVLYRLWARTGKGRLYRDRRLLCHSIFGTFRLERHLYYFSSNAHIMIAHGVHLSRVLEILAYASENRYMRLLTLNAKNELEHGKSLYESFRDQNIFPEAFLSILRIGEESGEMVQLLNSAALFYRGKVERKTERLLKLIEPALILVLAVVVGFVVFSIAIPMFDLVRIVGE